MGLPVHLDSRVRCFAIAIVLSLAVPSWGQPPVPAESPPRPPAIENVKPDVFYLRDANGNLVLVPDFSLEDYNRLTNPLMAAQGPLPPYSLSNVVLSGSLGDDRATLELRVEIKVDRATAGPMRIPLGLSPAILREVRYEGPGKAAVAFDRAADAYLCWLEAESSTRHVLTLDLLTGIRKAGDSARLELLLPDALTHIDLVLPQNKPEVLVEGEQFLLQPPRPLTGGGAKVELDGYGGQLQLRWKSTEGAASDRPSLNVNATTVLTVEDPTYLRAEIALDLRVERGDFEAFHVRLPPGMSLVAREIAGYTAQVVEPGSAGQGPLVRVDLDAPSDSNVSVVLFGELSRTVAGTLPIETVGYEVREAFYQRTELLIAVDGEWSVRTVQSQNVRRVGSLTDAERTRGTIAKYIYYANRSQPASLRVSVHAQESLITIEPRYVLRIVEQRALLDMILSFQVRGAPAKGIELWLGDWTLREIRPSELLDFTGAPRGSDPRLLPITFAADRLPASGQFELRFSAERPIDAGSSEPTSLELPRPQGTSRAQEQAITIVPALLAVTAAENLDFAPALTSMPELTPSAADPASWFPADLAADIGSQRLLQFQAAASSDPLRFVGLIRRRPQTIGAKSYILARFDAGKFDVQQTIELDIRHQPLQVLTLEAPAALISQGPVTVLLGEDRLNASVAPVDGATGKLKLSCTLPVPLLGPGTLRLSYQLALPNLPAERRQNFVFPAATLATELPSGLAETQVTLEADPTLWQFDLVGGDWELEQHDPGRPTYRVAGLAGSIPLEISAAAAADGPTEAQRVWFQTVFTGQSRVDRGVFRLQTRRRQIDIQLPAGASRDPADISVAVNGREAPLMQVDAQGVVTITLDQAEPSPEYVVEIWYGFPAEAGQVIPSHVEFARLRGASGLFVRYWQLIMPRHVHLLGDPVGMTPEHHWKWQNFFFGRTCHMRQRDLEDWTGAVHAQTLGDETNQYLYSSYGPAEALEVRAATRSALVLIASGLTLALGFAWIYLPVTRHPAALLVLAVAGFAAVLIRPALGLVLAQAASAGVLLVITSRLSERLFARPPLPVRATRAATTLGPDSARSDSILSVPTIGTTTGGGAQFEMSSGDARP